MYFFCSPDRVGDIQQSVCLVLSGKLRQRRNAAGILGFNLQDTTGRDWHRRIGCERASEQVNRREIEPDALCGACLVQKSWFVYCVIIILISLTSNLKQI